MDENKKKNVIIVGLIIIIVVLIGILVFNNLNGGKKENKVNEMEVDNTELKDNGENDNKDNTNDIVIKLLKKYYKDNGLSYEDNIKEWEISSVENIGTEGDNVIYRVEGKYSCKDGSYSCVYLEQVGELKQDNTYDFGVYVAVDKKCTEIIYLTGFYDREGLEDILTRQEAIDMLRNKLIDSSNESLVKSFVIDKVTYYGYFKNFPDERIYILEGSYSCVDKGTDCIYMEQVEENSDGSCLIHIYLTVDSNNDFVSMSSMMMTGPESEQVIINEVLN